MVAILLLGILGAVIFLFFPNMNFMPQDAVSRASSRILGDLGRAGTEGSPICRGMISSGNGDTQCLQNPYGEDYGVLKVDEILSEFPSLKTSPWQTEGGVKVRSFNSKTKFVTVALSDGVVVTRTISLRK
jgi:hypothetical protein